MANGDRYHRFCDVNSSCVYVRKYFCFLFELSYWWDVYQYFNQLLHWLTVSSVNVLLTDSSSSQMTLASGHAQPQFVLSTANVADVEQQALIQQLFQQNALVVGCNPLLVTSAGRLNLVPTQTVECVATSSANATANAESNIPEKNVCDMYASHDKVRT